MTRRTFTPDELRELAKDRSPFFADTARAALAYCADALEAADKAVRHEAADAQQARAAASISTRGDEPCSA